MEEVKYYLKLNLKIGLYFKSCINFYAIRRFRKTCLKSLLVCGAYCGKTTCLINFCVDLPCQIYKKSYKNGEHVHNMSLLAHYGIFPWGVGGKGGRA